MSGLVLHDFHKDLGAHFISKNNYLIPSHYGNSNDELNFALSRLVVIDQSYFGKIKLQGPDSLDLINRITTNDMTQLIIGSVCDTVFITPKGRIVDYARVMRFDDHLILICRNMDAQALAEWVNRFIFLEDIQVSVISNDYVWLTVMGPESLRFIRSISGEKILEKDEQIWITHENLQFPALLNNNYMVPAYNFCVPESQSRSLALWLADELERFGGSFMGDDAFQVVRIKSGTPAWGSELNEKYNPHEARLLSAVSFTKECYTGQEVIARLDTYDKVQRHLMILSMDEHPAGTLPLEVYYGKELIGNLTSITDDHLNSKSVGLAYIKKHYALAEVNLQVDIVTPAGPISAVLSSPPSSGEPSA